jgi:hydrogenase-4 membrane subunit HyfE
MSNLTWKIINRKTLRRLCKYHAGQKILPVIVCQLKKKKKFHLYFIVIMITVLIMNVIFWVVNQNSTLLCHLYYTERLPQVIYVRLF